MTASRELIDRIRELAEGSPYVPAETPKGFDLRMDVADARWHTLMYRHRLTKVCTHHVRLDASSRTFKIIDDCRTVSWRTGAGAGGEGPVPVLSARAERIRGRSIEVSKRVEFGWNEAGDPGKVVDYRLDSREGHRLIRKAAQEAGWKERMPAEVKGAIVMAAIGGLGAVAAVVVLFVQWLIGT
ncbi:hypothetical protein [Streptomyces meridianus]|uniref:Uncharacterized protein n=1 Tax=Streptomyces meridianus TaxID=2938945 RepID=A0ABT0X5Z6_9ACTN|nr:hypothetical protein [Streptomyces meridianus]MCM2577951.1 hypothetical protein [Streptomyces meridianus]